ncbi:heparan-alpha-glucosaminide N-acetyltransferase-like [Amphibalanus amphitrite]|uniref:heparan-alpha-glucosaminide N-acetyltransferase-like n=1 Tax=Amphibalanus amphitrite TaxID=1232801 RepID=UPI001C917411|nr:heparan-alpha-glucosaminide N-acetyltransferase-like [Amphibalanus amphitrite]XP_043233912.1 heparan-alpha-glucosaminide N-acetyltransferase-like [Amphibalanus amphitrite]XP_043233913.1 heparan-alpha-glucosaminide N-acetyltransferase-like [Amphibalanus amphitrite]
MSAPPPPPPPPRLLGMNWEQPFACGRPGSWLAIDQACVAVANGGWAPLTLWAQSDQCHGCDSWPVMRVPALAFGVHSVNTTYGTRLSLRNDNGTSVCRLEYHFGEFGWYQLSPPKHSGSQRCSLAVVTEPANIYAPLLLAVLTLIGITLLIKSINKMREHYVLERVLRLVGASSLLRRDLGDPEESTTMVSEEQAPGPAGAERRRARLHALDVFRG